MIHSRQSTTQLDAYRSRVDHLIVPWELCIFILQSVLITLTHLHELEALERLNVISTVVHYTKRAGKLPCIKMWQLPQYKMVPPVHSHHQVVFQTVDERQLPKDTCAFSTSGQNETVPRVKQKIPLWKTKLSRQKSFCY
uniref:(northern house mosquito) hypothetical protein n=1 Tax=Culex pipiens TaxID=7175 RepID=A0A8D8B217_CULPI